MENNNKILVAIVNYNFNSNAKELKEDFSKHFDTVIIDSGSDVTEEFFDYPLENVGYSGLFNKACELFFDGDYDGLFFICSDVFISKKQVSDLVEKIKNINLEVYGVYSPSSRGQSHQHCKKKGSGFREVVFIEGFIFCSSKSILQDIYPIDVTINKLGYGIDVHKGYNCYKMNKKCVIDNDIEIYHREGTGYDAFKATEQLNEYFLLNKELGDFWKCYFSSNYTSDIMLNTLREKGL